MASDGVSATPDPPDEQVPCYWGGALAVLASPARVRFVLGALRSSLDVAARWMW